MNDYNFNKKSSVGFQLVKTILNLPEGINLVINYKIDTSNQAELSRAMAAVSLWQSSFLDMFNKVRNIEMRTALTNLLEELRNAKSSDDRDPVIRCNVSTSSNIIFNFIEDPSFANSSGYSVVMEAFLPVLNIASTYTSKLVPAANCFENMMNALRLKYGSKLIGGLVEYEDNKTILRFKNEDNIIFSVGFENKFPTKNIIGIMAKPFVELDFINKIKPTNGMIIDKEMAKSAARRYSSPTKDAFLEVLEAKW
jgi:hypothetical protein